MGELLANHTTLRLGGPADRLLTHTDPAHWTDLAHSLRDAPPPFVLGGGSNTLAEDARHRGTVIRMATRGITTHQRAHGRVEVTVQAGEPLAALVAHCVSESLSGIEYLSGIPGTVGAAPVHNTGAYGQQISDVLTRLTVYDWQQHTITEFHPDQCAFGYRTSLFKAAPGRWTILQLVLRLTRTEQAAPVTNPHLADALGTSLGARPPLAEAAAGVLSDRHQRGLALPEEGPDARQAGSVFTQPAPHPRPGPPRSNGWRPGLPRRLRNPARQRRMAAPTDRPPTRQPDHHRCPLLHPPYLDPDRPPRSDLSRVHRSVANTRSPGPGSHHHPPAP